VDKITKSQKLNHHLLIRPRYYGTNSPQKYGKTPCLLEMDPVEQMKYQSLANLHLNFQQDSVQNYTRSLELKKGVITIKYNLKRVNYTREVLASAIDQTIVIRITADKPGSISFDAELRGERNDAHSNYATDYFLLGIHTNHFNNIMANIS